MRLPVALPCVLLCTIAAVWAAPSDPSTTTTTEPPEEQDRGGRVFLGQLSSLVSLSKPAVVSPVVTVPRVVYVEKVPHHPPHPPPPSTPQCSPPYSRHWCPPGEGCTPNGVCAPLKPPGTPCSVNAECLSWKCHQGWCKDAGGGDGGGGGGDGGGGGNGGDGGGTRCAGPADCPSHKYCTLRGRCEPLKDVFDTCSSGDECRHGVCRGHMCRHDTCAKLDSPQDCPHGHVCSNSERGNTCAPRRHDGDSCSAHGQCQSLRCEEARCVRHKCWDKHGSRSENAFSSNGFSSSGNAFSSSDSSAFSTSAPSSSTGCPPGHVCEPGITGNWCRPKPGGGGPPPGNGGPPPGNGGPPPGNGGPPPGNGGPPHGNGGSGPKPGNGGGGPKPGTGGGLFPGNGESKPSGGGGHNRPDFGSSSMINGKPSSSRPEESPSESSFKPIKEPSDSFSQSNKEPSESSFQPNKEPSQSSFQPGMFKPSSSSLTAEQEREQIEQQSFSSSPDRQPSTDKEKPQSAQRLLRLPGRAACTSDLQCQSGHCVHLSCSDAPRLRDIGAACGGSDGDRQCRSNRCSPQTGRCVRGGLADNKVCTDVQQCAGTCSGGFCVGGGGSGL